VAGRGLQEPSRRPAPPLYAAGRAPPVRVPRLLAAESVMLEQALRTPLVDQAFADAGSETSSCAGSTPQACRRTTLIRSVSFAPIGFIAFWDHADGEVLSAPCCGYGTIPHSASPCSDPASRRIVPSPRLRETWDAGTLARVGGPLTCPPEALSHSEACFTNSSLMRAIISSGCFPSLAARVPKVSSRGTDRTRPT
jgi:hypothetical protein